MMATQHMPMCTGMRAWLILRVLLLTAHNSLLLEAQEVALLHSPAGKDSPLTEQLRLLRWAPAVPPAEWKCWGMGNGARDWRNGDLDGCHTFMAHEAHFNGEDIRALTRAMLVNGTDMVSVDLAASALGATPDDASGVEAIGELLSSPLGLEQVNLENNGFGPTDGVVLGKAIGRSECPARLRLGWNSLEPAGAEALAVGLASGESGLRELSLEENALADEGRGHPPLNNAPQRRTVC